MQNTAQYAVLRQVEQQARSQGVVDMETGMMRAGQIPGQLTWANNTAVNLCQQAVSLENDFQRCRFFFLPPRDASMKSFSVSLCGLIQ